MKKYLSTILVLLLIPLIIFLSPGKNISDNLSKYFYQDFERAVVTEVLSEELNEDPNVPDLYFGEQDIKVKITSGKYDGQIFESTNLLNRSHNILAKKNLKIVVGIRETDEGPNVWVYNYDKTTVIYALIALFIALLLIFGGFKGLKSAVSLLFTGVMILFVMIPLIFKGYNPSLTAITVATIITVISFILISGLERKTLAAILGTVAGITAAGLISYVSGELAHLSGMNMEKGEQLLYIASDYQIQIRGLMFSAILISSLGAVMDVTMSIASSMSEIHAVKTEMSRFEILRSGMNVGKDIMGTMANTLILAFTGGSLALIMLIWGYQMEYIQFINMPVISIEIIQGLAGSIGIILSVPFTAVLSSFILKFDKKK